VLAVAAHGNHSMVLVNKQSVGKKLLHWD